VDRWPLAALSCLSAIIGSTGGTPGEGGGKRNRSNVSVAKK
jgi:hypothetical protein